MDEIIINICKDLNILDYQVKAVLDLLKNGNTIPFIARYRKEKTGSLNEEEIRKINEVYTYQINLLNRKEEVIRLIDEKKLLTDEIKNNIMNAKKLVEVEDLYRPYKDKKKTKATDAIKNGLEPLAKIIMSLKKDEDINNVAKKFLNNNIKKIEDAINGAKYIIAEWISDNAYYRKNIRNTILKEGIIKSEKKKNATDKLQIYKMYYNFEEKIKTIKPHRVLALNRGEKEKILNVTIQIDENKILNFLNEKVLNKNKSMIIEDAIKDSYKRLIFPSIEREIRTFLKDKASDVAIYNFSKNVESLLLTPPIKNSVVMGFDPAFRTGCKLAVLDPFGNVLDIKVIYPNEPHNKILESEQIVIDLINKYNIDIIAIGNGTASRESEKFIANTIKKVKRKVEYIIVSEAGASVYSASLLAIKEFPDLTVEKRSAISIGRRLQDALAELVKIDPKNIGVGLYQHDIQGKKLDESLNFVVSKVVNQVGVNINTASYSLLSYVSGLNKKVINQIMEYKNKVKYIKSREEIKNIKYITPKIYEQSIGFMRIIDGSNPLDKTSIHPENYGIVKDILKKLNLNINDIGKKEFINIITSTNINSLELNIDKYTLEDIIKSLIKPNRDPRDEIEKPILRSDILNINDLNIGDILQGTVRNVVDFGAFIDIGLHNDGLIHISKISNDFIKDPKEILKVGDIVKVKVIEINKENERVSLSMI